MGQHADDAIDDSDLFWTDDQWTDSVREDDFGGYEDDEGFNDTEEDYAELEVTDPV